ncbi:hypothetical protein RB614_24765 [Phytohabitans sp. ZYX-F-186]|uniref:Isoniazid-inducible protein iniC n=1 Tax=Phytohabitans maris TaxID=3071409 RepID=A0ABU0ZL13_9ACTN|nr:hypothetical protein [Phytohabitans sp. ZYX-F-186]MDQ7907739.1 hypothetical protein [Phytohabitans sp. ZYX-F-186]
MTSVLEESVWRLMHEALDLYHDSPAAADQLRHHLSRFDEPLRIAIAGPWQAGKSTLVNAIVGEEVAPIEVPDAEQVFTWYQDGAEPHATAYPAGIELPVARTANGLRVDIRRWRPAPVNDLVVTWPSRALRNATIVDTPALPDAGDKVLRDADAVLYLTRDGRGTDLEWLESAQDGTVARAAPVNVILVLSRADEIGGGRIDALLAAKQLARKHHRDHHVGSLCLAVVALGGLIALAGRVLSDRDYSALSTLARTPRPELEPYLLTTDRFVGEDFPALVDVETREDLLDRLGIFGVRLATTLIRTGTGTDTRAGLAAELVRRSGLSELREAVGRCFVDRADALKARSALAALEAVLRTEPRPGSEKLLADLEHTLTNAHDFRELRLVAALQGHRIKFGAELEAEARRLVGEGGTTPTARLGVDPRTNPGQLWELATGALARWQEQTEDPLLSLEQRRAAAVVVRSCEGIIHALSS